MNQNRGKVIVVVGAQYGSEGKGQVAAVLAEHEKCTAAVRTGSINAGHTVHYKCKPYVMQLIPTAWVLPDVELILGAGCYILPELLQKEVDMIREASGEDIRDRLIIDSRCVWFGSEEQARAAAANRHHAMGATGKGASEAIVSKMYDRASEHPQNRLFEFHPDARGYAFGDTAAMLHATLEQGENVLLEGTQGAMLDFNLGPYPYVTTRMTNAAAWLAECGLPPVNVKTVLVVRSHPIRVAGNSGPMPDEIDWLTLAREINNRQMNRGLAPVAPSTALFAFEEALERVVLNEFPLVTADTTILPGDRTKFHKWTPEQKVRHRECVSEANARALRSLAPSELADLRFFERTTVTKKLRRIARLNLDVLREAIRFNAPDYLVYTFLNYDFPELYAQPFVHLIKQALPAEHISKLERELGVPVKYVTTGPLPDHQIKLD